MTTRSKPRIHRGPDGWRVTKPGYGFGKTETLGPFSSHAKALEALAPKTASAGPDIQRTYTPSTARYRADVWPLEFR